MAADGCSAACRSREERVLGPQMAYWRFPQRGAAFKSNSRSFVVEALTSAPKTSGIPAKMGGDRGMCTEDPHTPPNARVGHLPSSRLPPLFQLEHQELHSTMSCMFQYSITPQLPGVFWWWADGAYRGFNIKSIPWV